MHIQRTGIMIASVAGIASWFLPFATLMFTKQSIWESAGITGYVIIIAFIASMAVAFVGDKKTPLRGGLLAGAIIPGIIPALLLIFQMIVALIGDFARMAINYEIGFFLMLTSSVVILFIGLTLHETYPGITFQDNCAANR